MTADHSTTIPVWVTADLRWPLRAACCVAIEDSDEAHWTVAVTEITSNTCVNLNEDKL
jgi:hypothetical protein